MFQCMECGKQFKTARSAEKASLNGCPKCGGVDVDLAAPLSNERLNAELLNVDLLPAASRRRLTTIG